VTLSRFETRVPNLTLYFATNELPTRAHYRVKTLKSKKSAG